MTLQFTKMNGAGNDFVMLDNRDLRYSLDKNAIAKLWIDRGGTGSERR
jgi:diaminopimelate epimerase